jgi:biotin carboxyl carrier protein
MEDTIMTEITAPMPGKICEVNVAPGDTVTAEQELVVLEAMKMEMPIVTSTGGIVASVNCSPGDAVQGGDVLVVVD